MCFSLQTTEIKCIPCYSSFVFLKYTRLFIPLSFHTMKKQNSLIVPKPKIEKRIDGIESSLSQMYEDIQTQLADHGEKLELLDILEVHDKRLSTLEVRLDKVIYALEKGNEEFRQFRNEFAKTRMDFEQTRQDFEQTRIAIEINIAFNELKIKLYNDLTKNKLHFS